MHSAIDKGDIPTFTAGIDPAIIWSEAEFFIPTKTHIKVLKLLLKVFFKELVPIGNVLKWYIKPFIQ